jgi:hypothetical protein
MLSEQQGPAPLAYVGAAQLAGCQLRASWQWGFSSSPLVVCTACWTAATHFRGPASQQALLRGYCFGVVGSGRWFHQE